jgi:hypothetical protein
MMVIAKTTSKEKPLITSQDDGDLEEQNDNK